MKGLRVGHRWDGGAAGAHPNCAFHNHLILIPTAAVCLGAAHIHYLIAAASSLPEMELASEGLT